MSAWEQPPSPTYPQGPQPYQTGWAGQLAQAFGGYQDLRKRRGQREQEALQVEAEINASPEAWDQAQDAGFQRFFASRYGRPPRLSPDRPLGTLGQQLQQAQAGRGLRAEDVLAQLAETYQPGGPGGGPLAGPAGMGVPGMGVPGMGPPGGGPVPGLPGMGLPGLGPRQQVMPSLLAPRLPTAAGVPSPAPAAPPTGAPGLPLGMGPAAVPGGAPGGVDPLAALMWQLSVARGEPLGIKERAGLGLVRPKDLPRHLQEELGYARGPIAQEAWEAQEEDRAIQQYATLAGVDLETGRLELEQLKFEHMKDAEQFDRMGVPERLKQQWAFEWALEEFREKGRERRASMTAGGPGGAGAKPPTPARIGVLQKVEGWYAELHQPAPQDMPYMMTSVNPDSGEIMSVPTGIRLREGERPWDLLTDAQKQNAINRISFAQQELGAGVGPGPSYQVGPDGAIVEPTERGPQIRVVPGAKVDHEQLSPQVAEVVRTLRRRGWSEQRIVRHYVKQYGKMPPLTRPPGWLPRSERGGR